MKTICEVLQVWMTGSLLSAEDTWLDRAQGRARRLSQLHTADPDYYKQFSSFAH